jgi:predicted Zn finger-like uncharacterized protein
LTNKTQCPECSAVFIITDEQLIRSKGKVRCGRCRNSFRVKLLSNEIAEDLDKQQESRTETAQINAQNGGVNDNNGLPIVSRSEIKKSVTPKLSDNWAKPQSASNVHPASDNSELSKADTNSWFLKDSVPSADRDAPQSLEQKAKRFHSEATAALDQEPSALDKEPLESNSPSYITTDTHAEQILADAFSINDDTPSVNFTNYPEPNKNNVTSTDQQTRDDILAPKGSTKPDKGRVDQFLTDACAPIDETPSFNAEDFSVSTYQDEESTDSPALHNIRSEQAASVTAEEVIKTSDVSRSAAALNDSEEGQAERPSASQRNQLASRQLIELDSPSDAEFQPQEVDQLIGEKRAINSINSDQNHFIDFSKTTKHSALTRWLFGPLLALMAILLMAVLSYQLWLKQAAPILESTQLAAVLEPISKPLKNQLKIYDIILPERRNLNQLELLSARTEAHPTRSSTILLRASLINRAKISQPFPWLELSLIDKDGRLVSRRALSPDDYLHNNRLENIINANELKRVTIELLTFPEQAYGFELRLLNK